MSAKTCKQEIAARTCKQEIAAHNTILAKGDRGIDSVQLTTIVLCRGTSRKQTGRVRVPVGHEFKIRKTSFCKV